MPEDMSPGASPFDMLRSASRGRLLWISSWALGFALLGIVLVAATNHTVNWSSSDKFCGTACHSMTWAAAAYQQSPHYINRVGIRASCGECHIPYDSGHATAKQYAKLLLFKADRGAKDFWYEARKSIATNEEWEKRRPALSSTFQSYLMQHNYITCRGCHSLDAFGGAGSHMKVVIHRGLANGSSFDCLQCHVNIGHLYEQSAAKVSGWYTVEQAAAGAKLFEQSCAACHGATLEGGGGPALSGATWKQSFGGAKLLRVWGEIKGPMADYAGATFTTQQSLDILAFLLQQNGLPAGNKPLENTRELSDALPEK
jgi:nitrate/TMAO reductase-like tetraheme cytochrome c subunit